MGAAAVAAASSINYGAAQWNSCWMKAAILFSEMNTRLQVEHPVTELITGLDLVALQLQVAQGEPSASPRRRYPDQRHAAIEAGCTRRTRSRISCPPPARWICGRHRGVGVRVDSGIVTGQDISFYDPMVAKIIASGPSREIARLD